MLWMLLQRPSEQCFKRIIFFLPFFDMYTMFCVLWMMFVSCYMCYWVENRTPDWFPLWNTLDETNRWLRHHQNPTHMCRWAQNHACESIFVLCARNTVQGQPFWLWRLKLAQVVRIRLLNNTVSTAPLLCFALNPQHLQHTHTPFSCICEPFGSIDF